MYYSLKRAAFWNIVGYAYLILVSFISTRWLLDGLGITQFATYALLLATVNILATLDLGLSQATLWLLSRAHSDSKKQSNIWSTANTLFLIDAAAVTGIAHLIVWRFFGNNISLMLVTDLWVFSTALLGMYSTFPQAQGNFGMYNIRTFLAGTANTLVVGFAALSGLGIVGSVLMQSLLTLLALIIFAVYIRKVLGQISFRIDRGITRELLRFGLRNQIGKLVGQGQAQYGKFILTLLSPLAVTAYSISRGVVMNLAGGVTQISTAMYPASAHGAKTRAINSLYHRSQFILLIIGIGGIIAFQLLGLPFLMWWLNNTVLVQIVHPVLQILTWYLAVLLLTPLAAVILDSHGYPGITSFFATVTLILEVALAFILLPKFGVLAPAYAALISIAFTTPAALIKTEQVMSRGLK